MDINIGLQLTGSFVSCAFWKQLASKCVVCNQICPTTKRVTVNEIQHYDTPNFIYEI